MIDSEIETLNACEADRSLEGLEQAVWARVAADAEFTRARALILGCQASIIALVLVGSIALVGLGPTLRNTTVAELDPFSPTALGAPSTLLLGNPP